MKFYERLSFRAKLVLQALLPATVALLLALIALTSYDLFRDRQRVTQSLGSYAEQLIPLAAAAMAFDDVKTAEQSLALLANEPQIVNASLYTNSGALFARYLRPGTVAPAALPTTADTSFGGNYLDLLRVVALDGEQLGTLFLRRSLEDIDTALRQRYLIGLSVFLAALAVVLVTSTWFGRQLSRPVHELVEVTRSFTRGDYGARAEKLSSDELGTLTDAFNKMLEEIEMRGLELARARDELEERVEERTRDLAASAATLRNLLFETALVDSHPVEVS